MEERRVNGDRRQRNRRQEDRLVVYFTNRIPLRRVPGTLILGLTNLIAGLFVVDLGLFVDSFISVYLGRIMPVGIWGTLFLISGAFLVVSGFYRRWWVFNFGATLSLFLWGAVSISIFASWAANRASLSPIALAMAWWMLAGQVAMLIVPLYKKWEDL